MIKLIFLFVVLFSISAQAEIGVVEQETETLKCSFSGETLFIQRSIPGIFPMMIEKDRNAVDAAMVPGTPFTAYQFIEEGDDLILRDTLPGGAVIDYFVNFEPAQNGKFFITMSEDVDVANNSGAMATMLSTDSYLGDVSGYGTLGSRDEVSAPVTKSGVCKPAINDELYTH